MKIDIKDTGGIGPVIAALENSGVHYLRVRLWPAPDGCYYMPTADIAALHDVASRAHPEVNAIGVSIVHEAAPDS